MSGQKGRFTGRSVDQAALAVNSKYPLDTLPLIADALLCIAKNLEMNQMLGASSRADVGAAMLLEMLAYTIDDTHTQIEGLYQRKSS